MMSDSITLVCERFFCSYCGGKEQATVQLCVEAWPHDSTIICLSCLLKAVGLLETELDSNMNECELEEETKMLEAESVVRFLKVC